PFAETCPPAGLLAPHTRERPVQIPGQCGRIARNIYQPLRCHCQNGDQKPPVAPLSRRIDEMTSARIPSSAHRGMTVSALNSIEAVLRLEMDVLGEDLRMVSLTDYIRKEMLSKRDSKGTKKLEVAPIFACRAVRPSYTCRGADRLPGRPSEKGRGSRRRHRQGERSPPHLPPPPL